MESEEVGRLVRTRRTHKVFGREPVDRETVDELLELARWAPNHHLTEPWRFRVLGPAALARLQASGGPNEAAKLERAPTLIVASCVLSDDPVENEEDLHATAAAVYIVLLAAHARGLAGYWRTPGVLRTAVGRTAVGLAENERVVALIHLGPSTGERPAPVRRPLTDVVEYLD